MNEEEKQLPCEDAGEGFEELIRGRYKEQFDARVQKILDGRLKNLRRENERLRESGQAERRLAGTTPASTGSRRCATPPSGP